MRIWVLALATLGCLVLALVLSTNQAPIALEGDAVEGEPSFLYSPYIVHVDGREPYDRVSFKDVGMSLPDQDRTADYEMLAEELASSLRSVPNVAAHAGYDGRLLDPHNHLSCGRSHVYVDVWQNSSERLWGYSLWSGCGVDDEFARAEVPFSDPVHPKYRALSQHIAAALETANETNCFSRRC